MNYCSSLEWTVAWQGNSWNKNRLSLFSQIVLSCAALQWLFLPGFIELSKRHIMFIYSFVLFFFSFYEHVLKVSKSQHPFRLGRKFIGKLWQLAAKPVCAICPACRSFSLFQEQLTIGELQMYDWKWKQLLNYIALFSFNLV